MAEILELSDREKELRLKQLTGPAGKQITRQMSREEVLAAVNAIRR
jgi:hypothetical protein